MYQPLLMNKTTFEGLTPEQQAALTDAGEKAQAFYLEEAKKGDADRAPRPSPMPASRSAEMTEEDFDAWRELAKTTSYPAFVEETPGRAEAARHGAAVE